MTPRLKPAGLFMGIFLSLVVNSQEKLKVTSRSVIAKRRQASLWTIHEHLHQFQVHIHEFLAVAHCLYHQR